MEGGGRAYSLRKRKRPSEGAEAPPLERLLQAAAKRHKVVVFTGSGLSAASGMSTFSAKGGLYERAQRKYGLSEGKKLFTYSFFERQKLDAQAFFAEIWAEARAAAPGQGHRALAAIERAGRLQRHYTLNVDGLAAAVGLSTWHPERNPDGRTVEMHGSIRQLVCPNRECREVVEVTEALAAALRARRHVPCARCACPSIRCRIMLYDDKDDECITPDDVFEVLEADMAAADLILWVGISFEQSASTHYFRKARECLLRAGRWASCGQAIVNLSEEAHFNLISACNNVEEVEVLSVLGSSEEVLPEIAAVLSRDAALGASASGHTPGAGELGPGADGTQPEAAKEEPGAAAVAEPSAALLPAGGRGQPAASQPLPCTVLDGG